MPDAAEIVLPHRSASLFETAGSRAEGDAVIPDLAFRLQGLEGLPDLGIPDRRRIGIVQLEHVDVRRPEPTQGPLERFPNRTGREVRARLGAAGFARDDHELSLVAERLTEELLPAAGPVGGGDIEVVDTGVVRLVEQVHRLIVCEGTPATRREGPDAEADLRHLEFGFPQGPIVHHAVPPRPQRRRGYLTATPAVASARRRRGGSLTRPAPRR